jgi:hypothetical protein
MYNIKYKKYKNKYISIYLDKLLLEDKLKLFYKLYKHDIIFRLYTYIFNNNIYDINIKYNNIIKLNILNNLLDIIIQTLTNVNSEYINIAYIIPLENIKNNL